VSPERFQAEADAASKLQRGRAPQIENKATTRRSTGAGRCANHQKTWGLLMPLLEEVYRLSGVPTHTFVEPLRYQEIKIAMRTPGRCIVIEGPSGIGKTTTVNKILDELEAAGMSRGHVTELSARRSGDVEYIDAIPDMTDIRTCSRESTSWTCG
jgi:Cdc6-like AAA superfamily ATPase